MHQGTLFFFPIPISQNRIRLFSRTSLKLLGFFFCFLEFLYNFGLFGIYILKDKSLLRHIYTELIVSFSCAGASFLIFTLITFGVFGTRESFLRHLSISFTIHLFLLLLQLVYLRFILYEDSLSSVFIVNDLFLNGIVGSSGLLLSLSEFGAYLLAPKRRHVMKAQPLFIMNGYFFIVVYILVNVTCTPVVLYFSEDRYEAYFFIGSAIFIFLSLAFMELFLRRKEFSRKNYNKIAQLDEEYY